MSKRKIFWISSFPKSGNTWISNILRTLAMNRGVSIGSIDQYDLAKYNHSPDLFPFVKKGISNDLVALKTHHPFDEIEDQVQSISWLLNNNHQYEICGAIYMLRHPLDVILSYINFSRLEYSSHNPWCHNEYGHQLFIEFLGMKDILSKHVWQATTLDDIPKENLDHALQYFMDHKGKIPMIDFMCGTWFDHVQSWFDAKERLPITFLKYEDLLSDCNEFLKLQDIFAFSNEEIEIAAKQQSRSYIPNEHMKEINAERVFYNKMSANYYVEYFSPHLIDEFYDKYGDILMKYGYKK